MGKREEKIKTEFVSLASHQLRTPLSAIAWYAEELLAGDAGKLTPRQRHYLSDIYESNRRMIALVDALLSTSRLELGTFPIKPGKVCLPEITKKVLVELKSLTRKKNLVFREIGAANIPAISADENLIEIILQNLLSNAVKYSQPGGQVEIEYRLVKKGELIGGRKIVRPSLLVRVRDQGLGIPKTQQHEIFTKLFRADNARELAIEGVGLGLYLAKSIINQSHGQIWFESEVGKGTTFYFTLPR